MEIETWKKQIWGESHLPNEVRTFKSEQFWHKLHKTQTLSLPFHQNDLLALMCFRRLLLGLPCLKQGDGFERLTPHPNVVLFLLLIMLQQLLTFAATHIKNWKKYITVDLIRQYQSAAVLSSISTIPQHFYVTKESKEN